MEGVIGEGKWGGRAGAGRLGEAYGLERGRTRIALSLVPILSNASVRSRCELSQSALPLRAEQHPGPANVSKRANNGTTPSFFELAHDCSGAECRNPSNFS